MMDRMRDGRYLRDVQYVDAARLEARIALHRDFSTGTLSWSQWLFDRLRLPANGALLELGCGPGSLWEEQRERVPAGWRLTLTDLSAGMLARARDAVGGRARLARVDAQAIPCPNDHFDGVLASAMLYHVPDRPRALAEVRRVLRPGGHFFATTMGRMHLHELKELVGEATGDRLLFDAAEARSDFFLEDATEELRQHFAHVERSDHPDDLRVTDAEPLVAYTASCAAPGSPVLARLDDLRALAEERIARDGAIEIRRCAGCLTAS